MTLFDTSGALNASAPRKELRRLAVQGAGATMFSQGLTLGIQISATMILARTLVPRDFGLVTMVTTFSLLLANFGLNGFSEAVIQRETIDHYLASNLFWLTIGAGSLLTVGFAAAGSLLAWFYREPLVANVARSLSLTIIAISSSVVPLALLKRAMRFPAISANNVIAQAVSVLVSILLAKAGWRYWALVGGLIAQPLSVSVGAWSLCRWLPSLPRAVKGTAAMVRFAFHVYGRFSLNYCTRNLDNFLVGWQFNAQSLGFYKKAYDLFALSVVIQSLTDVAVSTLRRFKSDATEYRRHLLSGVSVAAFLGMGVGAHLTLIGRDLIRLLLGPGWGPAGRIFVFFGPGMGMMFLYGIHGWIHLSIGRADRWLKWAIVEVVFTSLLFVLALRWGPAGVAASWTLSLIVLTVPAVWYAGRPIGLAVSPVISASWRYAAAALMAGFGCASIVRDVLKLTEAGNAIMALELIVVKSLVCWIVYLGAVIVLHQGYRPLFRVLNLLREMVPVHRFPKLEPALPSAESRTQERVAPAPLLRRAIGEDMGQ